MEAYATNFIDKLYLNVLQRAADPGGLAYWVEQFLLKFGELRNVFLATGRSEAAAALEARAIYLEQFTNSQEMKDSTAPWISAFLTGAAQDPDPAGLYTGSLFNDPTVAVGDAYQAVGGVALIVDGPGVLANDSDVDGQALSATLIAGPDTAPFSSWQMAGSPTRPRPAIRAPTASPIGQAMGETVCNCHGHPDHHRWQPAAASL